MIEGLHRLMEFLLGKPLPDASEEIHTRWVQLSNWSDAELLLVVALVAVILCLSIWNLRRVNGWRARSLLFALRIGLIAILLFAFLQPALLEERRAQSTNVVLMLMDDSASMALPQGGVTRGALAADFVSNHEGLWRELEKTNIIESYTFGDSVTATKWRDFEQATLGRGSSTRLIELLEELQDRYRNRDIGGIVLISDGIDNGRLGRALSSGGALDPSTRRFLASFGAPIHTVGLDPNTVQDVSIRELRYSPFAFKRNLTELEAIVDVHGYSSGQLEIELLEEGQLVRTLTYDIRPGQDQYTASFEFTPVELGHRVYTVRVKPFPDEVTLENNERHAVIRINRDKIRVLQIAGHPSWDVRFLRNHLRQTPNIQLISFFILIRQGQGRAFKPGETSLIPFPAQQLFVEELGSFDLVILQDFNYGPFNTDQHLFRIRDYVRDGGALVMVGGRLSFGAGNWDGTELESALPVQMTIPKGEVDSSLSLDPFQVELSQVGETHSITRLGFDPVENKKAWSSMPEFYGANRIDDVADGALVLLEHPSLKTRTGAKMPILAIGEPDKGRVAAIASDSLWRMKMPFTGAGGDGSHYDTLWNNLIRWLVRDPDLNLIRVAPSAGVRALGEDVTLDIRTFAPDYTPQAGIGLSLSVHRRAGMQAEAAKELVFQRTDLETDDTGRTAVRYKPVEAGVYDVDLKAVIAGRQIVAKTVFVVSDERPEMRHTIANQPLLAKLSEATGGQALSLNDSVSSLPFNPPRVSDVINRRYHERWNVPAVFFLAVLLMSLEWWYRRRIGFL